MDATTIQPANERQELPPLCSSDLLASRVPKVINHIGLSSGKDSTALWGWAINESGYPPETIRGSFCDTEFEYPEVYEQIKTLDEYGQKRGVSPIKHLKSLGFLSLAIKKKRFSSTKARFCTEELKIIPSVYYYQELQLDGYEILGHTGERRTESPERANMTEFGEKKYREGGTTIKIRRPLLDWSLADVWAAHKRYGLPINPLYFAGRMRVGCKVCIMSSKRDVRKTLETRPETLDEIKAMEAKVTEARIKYREAAGLSTKTYASFFDRSCVPEVQRSIPIITKEGVHMNVCDIYDVARWSQTLHGGTQGGFQFMFEEEDFTIDDSSAPCQSGYCE